MVFRSFKNATYFCCCCSVTKSCPTLCNPCTVARQALLYFTISRSLLKFMSTESVMLSNHLILCHPLLLLPSILPSIRVFFNESVHCIRQPKYWSFSINPSNEYSGLISLQSKRSSRVFSSTTIQKHQFFSAQPSLGLGV